MENVRTTSTDIRRGPAPAALYAITFPNGKRYIGKTIQKVATRFRYHVRFPTSLVGKKLREIGTENVKIITLAIGSEEYIFALEKVAIEKFNTLVPNGYNIAAGGDGGAMPLPETILKMAAAQKGKKQSPEHIEKTRAYFKTVPRTAEWCANISKSLTGREIPEAEKERLRTINIGRKHAPEVYNARRGRPAWNKGISVSLEARAKMSQTRKGKPWSAARWAVEQRSVG